MKQLRKLSIVFLAGLLQSGCMGVPEGATVVTAFDLDRYLGTWYEIARMDHRVERGMSIVTANSPRRRRSCFDLGRRRTVVACLPRSTPSRS